jgi:hypothetical protein
MAFHGVLSTLEKVPGDHFVSSLVSDNHSLSLSLWTSLARSVLVVWFTSQRRMCASLD